MEFIFFNERQSTIPVPKSVRDDFEFAHSELGENRKPNEEWAFWKPNLDAGKRVPVFVLMDGDQISSMGLAMMFRLPYKHSIHETIRHTSESHLTEELDLAELLFGRVDEQDSLRGRVCVETLLAEGTPQPLRQVLTVLNGPKPTYYPNYIVQNADANGVVTDRDGNRPVYKTFMDADAEIRGWKRYIVRRDSRDSAEMPRIPPLPEDRHGQPNRNVATAFRPLPAGTTFSGTIHLHNVRPEELGALVWALTWGGDTALRHSLGMGKSLGFGSVTVEITGASLAWCNPKKDGAPDPDACMGQFEHLMEQTVPQWKQSDQIRALCAMANPATPWPQELRYPTIGLSNEFVTMKQPGLTLVSPVSSRQRPTGPLPGSGDVVECEVLEEQTRRGGLKFKVVGRGDEAVGVLHPQSAPVPPEKTQPGSRLKMRVAASAPKNMMFKVE